MHGTVYKLNIQSREHFFIIIFFLYIHLISEIVSYHSLSHHSFSDDNKLYKSGNVSQLPEIIHSNQSGISDIKAWMTNNQLHLNNDM